MWPHLARDVSVAPKFGQDMLAPTPALLTTIAMPRNFERAVLDILRAMASTRRLRLGALPGIQPYTVPPRRREQIRADTYCTIYPSQHIRFSAL
jgi:hypothetical protein